MLLRMFKPSGPLSDQTIIASGVYFLQQNQLYGALVAECIWQHERLQPKPYAMPCKKLVKSMEPDKRYAVMQTVSSSHILRCMLWKTLVSDDTGGITGDMVNLRGPSVAASLTTPVTTPITAPIAAPITASVAAPVATSIATSVTAAVAASIAEPVEEAPALPEVRQTIPDPFLRSARLATPLELAGHEYLDVGPAVVGMAFWGQCIALDSIRLVSRRHGRDGLWLRACWRQELDRVIARNSDDQAERSRCHCCLDLSYYQIRTGKGYAGDWRTERRMHDSPSSVDQIVQRY